MGGGYRPKRVASEIHRELSTRLRGFISETEWGYISITHVDVSSDLQRAVISYMPLGGGEITQELQEAMAGAAKRLRGPIGRALRVRTSPELIFKPDTHTEDAVRMTALLNQIGETLRDEE